MVPKLQICQTHLPNIVKMAPLSYSYALVVYFRMSRYCSRVETEEEDGIMDESGSPAGPTLRNRVGSKIEGQKALVVGDRKSVV